MAYLTDAQIASMRATVLNTQLDHVCSVMRITEGADDEYNQPTNVPVVQFIGVSCHYWEEAEEEVIGEANALVTTEKVVFPANTDITSNDLITSVTGYDDVVIATNLNVIEVIKHVNHVLAVVKSVR